MLESIRERWIIYTLVDITNTGVVRGSGKQRNQQRNYETLQQTVSILAQPWTISDPVSLDYAPRGLKFGDEYTFAREMFGEQRIWRWQFGVETPDVFGPLCELLTKNLHNIPIVTGLDETMPINTPVFSTSGANKNVVICGLGS